MGQALSRAEGAQQAAAASLFAGWQEKLIASALGDGRRVDAGGHARRRAG